MTRKAGRSISTKLLLPGILAGLLLQLALGMAPSAFAANQKATVEGHNPGHTAPGPLPNFHQVHPYLFRGGQPDRQGVDKLHVMGIKTVIDLRAQTADTKAEKAQVEGLGMRYIILPMSDKAPSQKQVDTFIETTSEAKAKGEPVYVHCAHGSDRTGCMVGIWRVSQDGFSYDQAYKEMRQYYFGPQFKQLSQAVKQRATK